jgi:predicted  nucleic acid-binding Zn-ribbon protein
MTGPEIDRRCLSCGATARQHAAFCPQCGQMLEKRDGQQDESDSPQPNPPTIEWDQAHAVPVDAESSNQTATDDGDEDNQDGANESPQVDAARSSRETLILRNDEDNDETESVSSDGRGVTVHDSRAIYETQPLMAKTNVSNATVSDLPDSNLRRPGDAPPRRREGPVLARVEKIRKVSSVMLDQAAYDPSLRFLLVAGALFVIFVILMILSKVLG